MDIQRYLERINYRGSLFPSVETLQELHLAHLFTVPFENLSVYHKEPIVLEDGALFNKIVERRRGGFCYELNGLFAALLRGLGFKVDMLSAGVARPNGGYGPEFDHMMLMVTLDERWLVDVGFGDGFRLPLRLDERGMQRQYERAYQLLPDGEKFILIEQKEGRQYRFSLQPYHFPDYAQMCHYHQTSPDSSFTQARLCSLTRPDGRITLYNMRLSTTSLSDGRQEWDVANEDEYAMLLSKHFGIIMR